MTVSTEIYIVTVSGYYKEFLYSRIKKKKISDWYKSNVIVNWPIDLSLHNDYFYIKFIWNNGTILLWDAPNIKMAILNFDS